MSTERLNECIRQLAAAVELQAVKDFFDETYPQKKRERIPRELRSSWMQNLTNGFSIVVAEQLELHPEEIRARILKCESEETANALS
jgi:hypothetical protein